MDGAEAELAASCRAGSGEGGAPATAAVTGRDKRVGLGIVDDADLHGGGAAVVGDALGVDQVPDPARLDAAQAHVGRADTR